MTHHINLRVCEHAEKRLSLHREADKQYSEATGDREVTKFTGPWAAVLEYGCSAVDGAKNEYSITVELERLAGGIGELTITEEKYRVATGGDSNSDSGSAGGSDGLGESEDHPCYTCSSSTVQECILAHPKFENIGDLPRRALKAMIDGQDENSFLEDETTESGGRKIKDCIGDDAAAKLAFKLIGKGITSFLNVQTEITARWKGRSNKYTVGEIVSTPPGGFKAVSGRDYLVVGSGVEKTGKETWCSATFRMSGAGGWKKELYSD